MAMTSRSDPYNHDDHLRHLLDQRAARADLHGRFPSLSEFPDSPSIYSHAHFSPRPTDNQAFDTNSVLHSPITDRERLNIPNASSLDLEDDPRSSFDSSLSARDEDAHSDGVSDDEADNVDTVSTFGPKIMFHSRAPWEMDEDDDSGQEEMMHSKRGRNKSTRTDYPKKPWGLPPRGSSEARPSIDSARSQGRPKQSLDTVSSFSSNGGALLALAQASMSSTSLAVSSSPQATSLRDKLSIPRLRSRTTSNTEASRRMDPIDPRHPSPQHMLDPFGYRAASPAASMFSHQSGPSISGPPSPHTPQQSREYMHPYANPDLVRDASIDLPEHRRLEELHALAHGSPLPSPIVGRSDSSSTLTESNYASSRSNTILSLTPVTSMSSVQTHSESSPVSRFGGGKGISSPIPLNKSVIRPVMLNVSAGPSSTGGGADNKRATKLMTGMPSAWSEKPAAAPIKLISLEEAQAQARERSRSATASATVTSFSQPDTLRASQSDQPSPTTSIPTGRSRTHSTSTGVARGKSFMSNSVVDLHHPLPPVPPDPSGNGFPQKVIVRKKSGFMRLFNNKEKERAVPPSPPPPLPHLSNDFGAMPSPTSATPRTRKGSTHRVPVPSLSPSTSAESSSIHSSSTSSETVEGDFIGNSGTIREKQLSARRNVPGLSIVTSATSALNMMSKSQQPNQPLSAGASETTHHASLTTPTTAAGTESSANSSIPSSAPPGTADFLNLRPVSTMFSKNFSPHLIDTGRPSLETDVGTPTTSTTAISPFSPTFALKLDTQGSVGIAAQQEEHSSVVNALQEQIVTARRAWQRQIWELEGQVRDLKAEVDRLRSVEHSRDYCVACGRGSDEQSGPVRADDGATAASMDEVRKAVGRGGGGVVNRPRARTGVGSRFASGT